MKKFLCIIFLGKKNEICNPEQPEATYGYASRGNYAGAQAE